MTESDTTEPSYENKSSECECDEPEPQRIDLNTVAGDITDDILSDPDIENAVEQSLLAALDHVTDAYTDRIQYLESQRDYHESEATRLRQNIGEILHALSDVDEDAIPDSLSAYVGGDAEQSPESFSDFEDCPLNQIAVEGPYAVIENAEDIYPRHRRAAAVIRNAAVWGRHKSKPDDWAVHVSVSTARRHLEELRGESLSSTQMKRVFEQVVEWGKACQSPPEIQKTPEGVRELIIYNPPRPQTG